MVWTLESDAPAQVLCDRMRVIGLQASGAILTGPTSMYVTDAVVKATFQPVTENGLELVQRNGSSQLCVRRRTPDLAKWYEFMLEICAPDPELEWLLTGGTVLKATNATIGLQAPPLGLDPIPFGVSIELWGETEVNGVESSTNPLFHWAFPMVKLQKKEPRVMEAGILANHFAGYAFENPTWGPGLTSGGWAYDSSKVWQRARVASGDMPPSVIGLQAAA